MRVVFRPEQCTRENAAAFAYDVYEEFRVERTSSGCGNRSRGCLQQSRVHAADGPAHSIWSQPNTDPVGCRSAPGKYSGYAAWKQEVCSSTAHNGPITRITALAGPLQCLTKGPADLNQNGPSKILTLADGGLRYKTSKDSQEAAEAVQQQLDSVSVSTWCHDTGSLISPDKAQTLWCTLDNRAAGKPVPAVTFDGAVAERTSQ